MKPFFDGFGRFVVLKSCSISPDLTIFVVDDRRRQTKHLAAQLLYALQHACMGNIDILENCSEEIYSHGIVLNQIEIFGTDSYLLMLFCFSPLGFYVIHVIASINHCTHYHPV
jgi:hypothetical protein